MKSIAMKFDAKIPAGPLAQKWSKHRDDVKLVNPSNKRKFDVIIVGSGLAGASAAASLSDRRRSSSSNSSPLRLPPARA